MSFLLFFYKTSKACKLEKENKQLKESLDKTKDDYKEAQKKIEELTQKVSKEAQKKTDEQNKNNQQQVTEVPKEFLDYCYKMAKSLDKGNEKQKEDCWKIILHNYANCIPDEMKKEYKFGKN